MIENWYVGQYGTALVVESLPGNYEYFATDEETQHHLYFCVRTGMNVAVRANENLCAV